VSGFYSGFPGGQPTVLRVERFELGLDNWIYAPTARIKWYLRSRIRANCVRVKTDKTSWAGSRDFRFRPDSGEDQKTRALDTAELVRRCWKAHGPATWIWQDNFCMGAATRRRQRLLEKMGAAVVLPRWMGWESILASIKLADVLWQFETRRRTAPTRFERRWHVARRHWSARKAIVAGKWLSSNSRRSSSRAARRF